MILIESQILPKVSIFKKFVENKIVIIEVNENYQKRSFRNKYNLVNDKGTFALTIPLKKGKNQQMPIKEVKISYEEDWVKQHLHTIKTAYNSAPYFDYIYEGLAELLQAKSVYLLDLNMNLLYWVRDFIDLDFDIKETTAYERSFEGGLDYRNKGMKAKQEERQIYPQVFEYKHGFTPDLSILDLMMCQGKESYIYLK